MVEIVEEPSASDLPYKARCTNPGWNMRSGIFWTGSMKSWKIALNCKNVVRRAGGQKFPFPRAVKRDEIESDGYMSGDFCLTMDQTQVLQLLTGENLYDNTDVFVRELLQNAIDATLLRGGWSRVLCRNSLALIYGSGTIRREISGFG